MAVSNGEANIFFAYWRYYLAVALLSAAGILSAIFVPEFDIPWKQASLYGGFIASFLLVVPMVYRFIWGRGGHDPFTLSFVSGGLSHPDQVRASLKPGDPGLRSNVKQIVEPDVTPNPMFHKGQDRISQLFGSPPPPSMDESNMTGGTTRTDLSGFPTPSEPNDQSGVGVVSFSSPPAIGRSSGASKQLFSNSSTVTSQTGNQTKQTQTRTPS